MPAHIALPLPATQPPWLPIQELVSHLAAGATIAQQTDVLVGMHGAGLANSQFMQVGASLPCV